MKNLTQIIVSHGQHRWSILTRGASLQNWLAPTIQGQASLVLGYANPLRYLENPMNLGCIVGRVAGRIRNASLPWHQSHLPLSKNHGFHHLHGGYEGLGSLNWRLDDVKTTEDKIQVFLSNHLPDGHQGYPGALELQAIYSLSPFQVDLSITSTALEDTVVNLAHHPYFSMSGKKGIYDDKLMVVADRFLELDEDLLPTGKFVSVEGLMDFRRPKKLGDVLNLISDHEQLQKAGGLDHNYIVNEGILNDVQLMATLFNNESTLKLDIFANLPGLQVYSGQGFIKSKHGFNSFAGIALESQMFPDAPNNLNFPSIFLQKGKTRRQRVIYRVKINGI